MKIKIIKSKISREELQAIAKEIYIDMVKGVADIERGLCAIGGEYHIDASEVLIKDGSKQNHIWGFNIYLNRAQKDRLEYTSLINIRPNAGNRSMEIEDEKIKNKILAIITAFIE